jgi:hypothetical protein
MSKNAKDNGSLFDLSIHTCSKSNTAKLIKHKKLIDNDLSSHRTSIRSSSSSSSSSSSASTFTSSCQQEKENNRKKSNISSRFSRLKLFGKRKSSSVQKDLQQQQEQQQEQQQKQRVSTATTSSKSKSISNWSKLKSR